MGRQGELKLNTWGGRREGAGRPPKGKVAGSPHTKRERIKDTEPVHVTQKVVEAIGRLRRPAIWEGLRWSLAKVVERADVRIVHLSIQGNHLHLIVEADDEHALARGMQAFLISAARQINAALSRRGQVFADRYDVKVLGTPRQVRNALLYVLNNWRKHREDGPRGEALDRYATGWHWDGWSEKVPAVRLTPETRLLPVSYPKSWLLTTGWRRHGLVSPWEAPAPPKTKTEKTKK